MCFNVVLSHGFRNRGFRNVPALNHAVRNDEKEILILYFEHILRNKVNFKILLNSQFFTQAGVHEGRRSTVKGIFTRSLVEYDCFVSWMMSYSSCYRGNPGKKKKEKFAIIITNIISDKIYYYCCCSVQINKTKTTVIHFNINGYFKPPI